MPLRFRILAAAPDARAAWVTGAASQLAQGPSEERAFEIASDLDEVRIGRQPDVELALPFPAVSSLHARLFCGQIASDWQLEDLGSMNGTWLDGSRLLSRRPVPLRPGQRLRIATVDIMFEGWSAKPLGAESTATIARRLISDLFGAVGGEVPRLVVESGSERQSDLSLAIRDRRYAAGRADSCDLVLASEHVSREHAAFIRRWDGVDLIDVGSRNGLLVNGKQVSGEKRLADGDRITVGTVVLRFTDPEDRYLRRLEALAPESPPLPPPSDSLSPPAEAPPPEVPPPASATDFSLAARRSSRPLTILVAAIALLALAGLVTLWLTTQ